MPERRLPEVEAEVEVVVVLPDRSGTRHLVRRGTDPQKTPADVHRLLGVLGDRHVFEGEPGHGIGLVRTGRLADPVDVPPHPHGLADLIREKMEP